MSTALGPVLIALLRGVIYADQDAALWRELRLQLGGVSDYVAVIGLELHYDDSEGYAFLRQRAHDEAETAVALPRLVASRPLSLAQSVLTMLLRKRLLEHDARGDSARAIVTRDELWMEARVYLPGDSNEARQEDQFDRAINKLIDYGLVRALKDQPNVLEIRRVIKALIDGEWLAGLEQRLGEYLVHARADD